MKLISAQEFAKKHHIYFDVVISLLRANRIDGFFQGNVWVVDDDQSCSFTRGEMEDIHRVNMYKRFLQEKELVVRNSRPKGLKTALDGYGSSEGYLYYDAYVGKCFFSTNLLESGDSSNVDIICISDYLKERGMSVCADAVRYAVDMILMLRAYYGCTVLCCGVKDRYAKAGALDQAREKAGRLFELLPELNRVEIYSQNKLVSVVDRQ